MEANMIRALPLSLVLAAACSGAPGATPNMTPASNDVGSDEYPAAHPPIPLAADQGRHLVLSPLQLVTITFAGDSSRDQRRTFGDDILTGDWWSTVTRGYGIGAGKGGLYVELPDNVSGKTLADDKDIAPMLQQIIDAGQVVPDPSTLFVIYLPASASITVGTDKSCEVFGAYHYSTEITLAGAARDVPYAVIADCGRGDFAASASHEIIEAATDPLVHNDANGIVVPGSATHYLYDDAWAGNVGGGEVADVCAGRGPATAGAYAVVKSWVNAAAQESKDPCQPGDPGKIFFGAAIPTEVVHINADPQKRIDPHDSSGYVVLARGATKTLEVSVFSEAKLPHDLKLVVGVSRLLDAPPGGGWGGDSAHVDPIAAGVTATLSAATGRNGQKRTLTLTADASTKPGDYPFIVRAILEPDDYHSWPVILRVQ
jgi:hypothetical protein